MEYKPFEILEDLKKVINDMTYELKFSKDKVKSAERINTLIKTLKCMDGMLVSNYYTDAIEQLILTLIYELLLNYKVYNGKPIPLPTIKDTLMDCFSYHSIYKRKQVISLLTDHEMKIILDKFNNTNNYDIYERDLLSLRTEKEWNILLKELINVYKMDIKWNTKK